MVREMWVRSLFPKFYFFFLFLGKERRYVEKAFPGYQQPQYVGIENSCLISTQGPDMGLSLNVLSGGLHNFEILSICSIQG